jgi:hypothetical protein
VDFAIEQRFPAPRAEVEAGFVDPAFITRLAELPKLGGAELLSQERDGARVVQRVRYRFTGELSSVVRRVIDPARLTWVEETRFDGDAHRSDSTIVPDNYADKLRCSMVSVFEAVDGEAGAATGTVRRTRGTIKVAMPLVGGKVEGAIVSGLREHAELETELLTGWLADARGV